MILGRYEYPYTLRICHPTKGLKYVPKLRYSIEIHFYACVRERFVEKIHLYHVRVRERKTNDSNNSRTRIKVIVDCHFLCKIPDRPKQT